MTTPAASNDTTSAIPEEPDIHVSVRQVFGIDSDIEAPAFSQTSELVPDFEEAYHFDRVTTLGILAGFAHGRRVMIQGYHGTGKSTHIEQVAARLKTSTATSAASILSARTPSWCATASRSPSFARACCRGPTSDRRRSCSTNTTRRART
jgi:hypothetical protein